MCCLSALSAQETNCGDGIDNDGDGLIDCYDGDCRGVAGCEDFFFNPPEPDCGYTPPELDEVELNLLYQTDETRYPIDQRSGVVVGDLDGDGIAELVSRDNNPSRIQIFDGATGEIKQSIVTPRTHPFGQMAIADVDEDGLGDIFHLEYTGVLARYEFGNPDAVWRTPNYIGDDVVVSTPQIADINQDGVPEVYVGDRIFDAITGERYVDGGGAVNTGGYAGGSNADRFPIYYDLFQPGDPRPDGNGVFGPEAAGMEYIAGNQVWTVDFDPNGGMDNGTFQLAAEYAGPPNLRDGFTSIADINGDGRMDIAVMDAGDVYAWDPYTNEIIGQPYQVPNTGSGGRINIGDFDGDGDVELGFAGRNIYIVRNYVDNDGDADPNNGTWSTLWQKTGLDDGSQRTGSTLFDFDGNGTVEVVYSEEENLFIYDGPTGMELFRITSRSGTRTEYPIVADVNGDGTAEIVVTAQELNGPQFSGTGWISVYESANQPWVPARDVWNQHGYNVTNINDDLTVPQFQQNNLNPTLGDRYNNFLVQTAVGGDAAGMVTYPAPDAIIMAELDINGNPVIDFSDCPNTITINLEVSNEGSAPLPASTPIAFYDGDPRVASPNLIVATVLGTQVDTGQTVIVPTTIDVSAVPPGSPVFLSVNDPGFTPAELPFDPSDFPLTGTAECDYTNNVSNVGNVRCGEVCDNGVDDDGDGIIDEPNLVQTQSTGCPGDVLNAITNDSPGGTYFVVGGSAIGTTVDANGVVTLGDNFSGTPVTETIRYDDGICTEDVTVTTVDDVAPTIACPGSQNLAVDAACEAFAPLLATQAQVSDNCTAVADISVDQTPVPGAPLTLGANLITLTAFDRSGNDASCTVTVTVVDQINPTVTCPANATVAVDAACNYTVPDLTGGATADDNCSAVGDIQIAQTPVAGQVRNGDGTNVLVTLTATDEAGNTANCTYVLTLADSMPPELTCPTVADQTLSNGPDGSCAYTLPDYRGQAQRRDNCSDFNQITLTQSPAPGTQVTQPGTTTVTITATDQAGNVSTCTFDQEVFDRDPPQLICGQFPPVMQNPGTCDYTVPDVVAASTITDNCGVANGVTVSQSPAAGTTFTGTFQNVTVTATDASGNSNICVTTLLPGAPVAPTIVCPADQTLVADADCAVPLPDYTGQATTDGCPPLTTTQSPAPGTAVAGPTNVTLTVRNAAGVATSCTFLVDVDDQTPPTIACPATQTLAVDGTCAVPLPDYTGQAAVADNCDPAQGGVTVVQSPAPGTMYTINDSPVTVTLTATDAAGNVADCSFLVQLMDNQPPMITCPVSPQTDALDGDCNARLPDFTPDATVSSTCGMSTFTLGQSPAPGTVISGEGTTAVTITATDAQGNSVSCTFDYVTEDVTPPTLTCPADQTEAVDGSCNFTVPDYTGLTTIADNCSSLAPASAPNLTVTQSPSAGTVVSGDGTVTTVTITATDAAGNSASCDFDLTLEDTTPPVVVCPADQTRDLDGGCQYVLEDFRPLGTATDNCTAAGQISIVQDPLPAAVAFEQPAVSTVTLTATDQAGNAASCSFGLTLRDVSPPSIVCPDDPTLDVDGACEARVPNLAADALAFDNCQFSVTGGVTVSQDVAAGTTLSGDMTTQAVVLTATDAQGLTATCTVTVTLDDVTPPTVVCPAATDLNLDPTGCQVSLPDYAGQLTLADNCTAVADLTVQQMPAPGTVLMGANTAQTVTFDVNDGNGNAASCQFDVTVRDVTDPTVSCPTPAPLTLDGDCMTALPDYTGQATAADDCAMTAAITLVQSPGPGTLLTFDGDQRTVTIVANDGNGNEASCSFTVVAEDVEAPVIACPADRDEEVNADCELVLPDYTTEATAMDNCSEPVAITITQSPAPGTTVPQAQLDQPQTITLTATDVAGNAVTCTFVVTPVDATVPTIVCPEPRTILLDAANCDATLGDYTTLATVMDNCSAPAAIAVSQNVAPGTVFNGLVPPDTTLVLTATDESGNTAVCELLVLIRDEVDPTVDCSAANQTVALDENCNGAVPDLIPSLVTGDNCSADALTIVQDPAPGSAYGGDGTTVDVTFSVTDASGNSVTCVATVTFEDQSPPDPVECPADQDLNVDDMCAVPLPDYTDGATVLDNCRAQEDIVVTQTPAPGTPVDITNNPTVNVTLTADDGNGNTAVCTFVVTLVDQQALDLTCPGGQIVIASSDDCDGVLEDYTGEVVTSNRCMAPAAGATLTQTPAAGTVLTLAQLGVPQTVTIDATDVNGNVSMCTFVVTLVDTLPPAITCPPTQMDAFDEACNYVIDDLTDLVTVEDNCDTDGLITLTQDPLPGTGFLGPNQDQVVTVSATDTSGNLAQCTFVLMVRDTTPAVVTCPAPDTLFTNGDCAVTIGDYTGAAVTQDNCTAQQDLTVTQDPAPGTVFSGDEVTTVVTITVTDGSGNVSACSFPVTAIDTVPPEILCPGDQIVNPDANCVALIPDYRSRARVMDNCATAGEITLTQRPAAGTTLTGQGDATQVTLVADDGNGNLDSCVFIVTLQDDVDPLIDCPADFVVDVDENCEYDLADLRPEADVTDNCTPPAEIIVTQNIGIGQTFSGDATEIVVTLTADDGNGNTAQCLTTVTLQDSTDPTIECPADQTIFVDASCEARVPDYRLAVVDDNCAAPGDITVTQVAPPATLLAGDGTNEIITLTADDGNGNTASCSFRLTLQDNTPPTIACPDDQQVFVDGDCTTTVADYTALATPADNCTPLPAVTQSPAPGTTESTLGSQMITLTADDGNGNATDCQFMLTVSDNTPPELVCPPRSVIAAGADCSFPLADYRDSVTVTDNCGPLSAEMGALTQVQSPAVGTMLSGVGASQIVTIMATDPSGNRAMCDIIVELADTTRPTIVCPADTTLAVDADCAALLPDYTVLAATADNCAATGNVTVTQRPVAGTAVSDEASEIIVTLTATDASGNFVTCDFAVQLIDTLAPEVVCPADDVISVDGVCEVMLPDYRPTAAPTDNCSAPDAITLAQRPAPGTPLSGDGTTQEVTIIATDESGNRDSCTLLVTLEDRTDPVINCPANQTVNADADCSVVIPDYTDDATVSSACDQSSITVVQDPPLGTTLDGHLDTETITLTATDASGNTVSCGFTVTLVDVTPPVIVDCQTDTVGVVDATCRYALPDYWALAPASAQDNCRPTGTTATTATGDQIIYTQSPPPGTVLTDAFTVTTVTLTADDGNGNTVSCDFELTLADRTDPTIVCPPDTVANPDVGCDFVLEDYRARAQVQDNCTEGSALIVTQVPAPGTVIGGQAFSQDITLTVADASGNTATCTFNLMLQDTTAPTIVCPEDKVEELSADCAFVVPDYTPEAVVADNCTPATAGAGEQVIGVTQTPPAGTVVTDQNEGDTFVVTLTADDGNGNTTDCDFTVTLDDVTPPTIVCPPDSTVFVDADCNAPLPNLVGVTTATDNCATAPGGAGLTITQSPAGTPDYNGDDTQITVLLTADDNNGNTSECQVTVTLQDTTRPTIVCPPNEVLLVDDNCEVSVPDYRAPAVVADNCTNSGDILVTQDLAPGTTLDTDGTMRTVTLTADDGNGNTTSCTLEIELDDVIPPTIQCPLTQTQFTDGSCQDELLDFTALAVVDDNCTDPGAVTVTQSPAAGFVIDGVGNTTVTLTADDGNGNTKACSFLVVLEDNDAPGIVCPPNQEIDFGEDCGFTLPDYRALAQLTDNCVVTPLVITQSPAPDSVLTDLGTTQEIVLTVTDNSGNQASCAFTVTTVSETPPPASNTVTLAVVNRPTGTGTVDLLDAFDNMAESNISNVDLDGALDPGPGPFVVTFYTSMADAAAEQNALPAADFDPAEDGLAVLARIEDPTTGCFVISQIILSPRTPGTSGAMDGVQCNRPGTVVMIDGRAMPGGQGTTIVRHAWRIIDPGTTGVTPANLENADQEVLTVNTSGLNSGTIIFEYQFFEEYGDGPVVPSVPRRVALELQNVDAGDFFWDGN